MSSAGRSEKTMSSRLLTMKFMQRAAASTPPSANSPAPDTTESRPSKRQRVSNGASRSDHTSSANMAAVKAALAAEEAKRVQAIEKQAAEAGETRWVLSFQDPKAGRNENGTNGALNVVVGGYADMDASDEEPIGRLNFGQKRPDLNNASSESDESDEDEDEDESEEGENDPAASLIREERLKMTERAREKLKARKKKRDQRMNDLGQVRRKKQVNLNDKDLRPNKRKGAGKGFLGREPKPKKYPDRPEPADRRWSAEKQKWELEY